MGHNSIAIHLLISFHTSLPKHIDVVCVTFVGAKRRGTMIIMNHVLDPDENQPLNVRPRWFVMQPSDRGFDCHWNHLNDEVTMMMMMILPFLDYSIFWLIVLVQLTPFSKPDTNTVPIVRWIDFADTAVRRGSNHYQRRYVNAVACRI